MNDRGHLSAIELDLLQLGTLPAGELEGARAHLASCDRCRARAAELDRARERFEVIRAPRWSRVEASLAKRPLWRWAAPLALAAAAAALLLVVRSPEVQGPLVKGDPVLRVYVLHGGDVRELQPGGHVVPGDRIRFAADGAGARYLLVVSVDGAGKASVYVPFDGARSHPLGPGRQELPDSVELDATLGPERLFAFFSDRPLEAAPLKDALAKRPEAGAVSPPCSTFVFHKEAP